MCNIQEIQINELNQSKIFINLKMRNQKQPRILIVDDEQFNLEAL